MLYDANKFARSEKTMQEAAFFARRKARLDEMDSQQKEARELVKKLWNDKRLRERKQQERSRENDQRYMQHLNALLEKRAELEKEKEEEKVRKRTEIQQRIQRIQREKDRRAYQMKEQAKSVSKQGTPLYKVLEERYQRNVEQEEIERHHELEENRTKVKRRVPYRELQQHQHHYEEIQREEEQRRAYRSKLAQDRDGGRVYRSRVMERVLVEDNEKKMKEEKTRGEKKKLQDKRNNYSRFVKEVHWPQVKQRSEFSEERKDPPYSGAAAQRERARGLAGIQHQNIVSHKEIPVGKVNRGPRQVTHVSFFDFMC